MCKTNSMKIAFKSSALMATLVMPHKGSMFIDVVVGFLGSSRWFSKHLNTTRLNKVLVGSFLNVEELPDGVLCGHQMWEKLIGPIWSMRTNTC